MLVIGSSYSVPESVVVVDSVVRDDEVLAIAPAVLVWAAGLEDFAGPWRV